MATINGTPSLFKTPEVPTTGITTDYETSLTEQVQFAREMATDTEPTGFDWYNDPEVQADLNAWHDSLDTPEAQEQRDAWCDEQERAELERREAELERQAEAAELASLGDSARHAIAGHDAVWQAGGQI